MVPFFLDFLFLLVVLVFLPDQLSLAHQVDLVVLLALVNQLVQLYHLVQVHLSLLYVLSYQACHQHWLLPLVHLFLLSDLKMSH